MKTSSIIALAVAGLVLLGGLGFYGYANSTRSDGMQMEQAMAAQYKVDQNELSTLVSKTYDLMDIANIKSAKMDSLLTHAIQGRYGKDGFKANGAFYAAVQEAYPQVDMSHYDRIADAVASGREAFKNQQNKLADMVRSYKTWRIDGMVRSMVTTKYFPSEHLEVAVGDQKFTGSAALAKIDQMVLDEAAVTSFQTGKLQRLDLKNR